MELPTLEEAIELANGYAETIGGFEPHNMANGLGPAELAEYEQSIQPYVLSGEQRTLFTTKCVTPFFRPAWLKSPEEDWSRRSNPPAPTSARWVTLGSTEFNQNYETVVTRSPRTTSAVGIFDYRCLERWVPYPSIRSMMATFAEGLRLAIITDAASQIAAEYPSVTIDDAVASMLVTTQTPSESALRGHEREPGVLWAEALRLYRAASVAAEPDPAFEYQGAHTIAPTTTADPNVLADLASRRPAT